jgi:hypothetical protein
LGPMPISSTRTVSITPAVVIDVRSSSHSELKLLSVFREELGRRAAAAGRG